MLNEIHLMASNVVDSILDVFRKMGSFNPFKSNLQIIFYISLALFLVGIITCIVLISRTYESRLLRSVVSFNRYFKKHPFINEDNLVEVNNRFKQVPKTLRYSWQEYMLNRDRQPSEYINSVSCIDQPTRSSSYKNISNTVMFITIMVAVFATIGNFACVYGLPDGQELATLPGLFQIFLFPLIFMFIGLFVVTFLKLLESSRYADLYYEFHEFERYLNKACSTMPSFVDYEVLFTPKEIRDSIPVLHDYMEKRALQEQKEKEEAELNANHFEEFNFEPVGVESSLLLDRAMVEGEKYFNFKRGITERINSKEQEMFNYQKSFDEVTKDYERKSQAVRESMASITEQLNATSVKIEANYLKKRYNEEQQKQQQLEKDYEYSKINFTKQQEELEQEIAQLSNEVKEKKGQVEENMMSECRSYSNKVWGEINKSLQAQQEPILKEKEEKARVMQEEIDKMTLLVADQDADIKSKQEYILKLEQDIKVRIAEIEAINNVRDYFNTPDFKQRVADKKKRRIVDDVDDDVSEPITMEEKTNAIEKIVNSTDREDKMKQEETELLEKLREVNKSNSEYSKEIEEINNRVQQESVNDENPFAAFTNIQKDIETTNNELINNQQDLANTMQNVENASNTNTFNPINNAMQQFVNNKEDENVTQNNVENTNSNNTENATQNNAENAQNQNVEEKPDADNQNSEAKDDDKKAKSPLQGLLDSAKKLNK